MTKLVIITDIYREDVDPEFEAEIRAAAATRPDDLYNILDLTVSDADPTYTVYLEVENNPLEKILRYA